MIDLYNSNKAKQHYHYNILANCPEVVWGYGAKELVKGVRDGTEYDLDKRRDPSLYKTFIQKNFRGATTHYDPRLLGVFNLWRYLQEGNDMIAEEDLPYQMHDGNRGVDAAWHETQAGLNYFKQPTYFLDAEIEDVLVNASLDPRFTLGDLRFTAPSFLISFPKKEILSLGGAEDELALLSVTRSFEWVYVPADNELVGKHDGPWEKREGIRSPLLNDLIIKEGDGPWNEISAKATSIFTEAFNDQLNCEGSNQTTKAMEGVYVTGKESEYLCNPIDIENASLMIKLAYDHTEQVGLMNTHWNRGIKDGDYALRAVLNVVAISGQGNSVPLRLPLDDTPITQWLDKIDDCTFDNKIYVADVAIKLMSFMMARPEEVPANTSKISSSKVRRNKVLKDALWSPNFIGHQYGVKLRKQKAGVKTRGGKKLHLRQAHSRRQRYGKLRAKVKYIWIDPCWVGGRAEKQTTNPE